MSIQLVTLEGQHVRLEPLTKAHVEALWAVGQEESVWRWIPIPVRSPDEMRAYVDKALNEQGAEKSQPFVTIARETNAVIGSTRYMNIDAPNRGLEIGSTWITPQWQRTAINTEAKYLMLRHAFESLGCIRVQLKTDSLNEKSRAAILRIGATQEGILRNHIITQSGRYRHSVFFSILDSEWPAVKANLEAKLARGG
jgi:RimJ/RimL family protein N-acetyltransferase